MKGNDKLTEKRQGVFEYSRKVADKWKIRHGAETPPQPR